MINSVIIGNSRITLEALRKYSSQMQNINLLACYDNVYDVLTNIRKNCVHLIFLIADINDAKTREAITLLPDYIIIIIISSNNKIRIENHTSHAIVRSPPPVSFNQFGEIITKAQYRLDEKYV